MKLTALQQMRRFIQNDMMQSSYTKEQILEMIDLMLIEKEKLQIKESHRQASLEAGFEYSADDWADEYYKNTYENE
jgi:hypothetical protein